MPGGLTVGRGVRRFTELIAWQSCYEYKKKIYAICEQPPLATDWKRRGQLEESVNGPPSHIAEGFGRFNPLDFARYVVIARASLMESQNHLLDCVDRGYITEDVRVKLDSIAEGAISEVTGLLDYLHSPEALRNARRARERRAISRPQRLAARSTSRTPKPAGWIRNQEPRTKQRTGKPELRTHKPELRTQNAELRTQKAELRTEPEHEPRTKNPEE